MPRVRVVRTSDLFIDKLSAFCSSSIQEEDAVLVDVQQLATTAEAGEVFVFSGYPGPHYVILSGRFLIIYQFSAREVRVKDIRLKAAYDS